MNEAAEEIKELNRELQDITDKITALDTSPKSYLVGRYRGRAVTSVKFDSTAKTTTSAEITATKITTAETMKNEGVGVDLTLNCTDLLGPLPPPPPVQQILQPASNIQFNSPNIGNVTVVLVTGVVVEEITDLASSSPEPVLIQCCGPDGIYCFIFILLLSPF